MNDSEPYAPSAVSRDIGIRELHEALRAAIALIAETKRLPDGYVIRRGDRLIAMGACITELVEALKPGDVVFAIGGDPSLVASYEKGK